jgi:tetratricopeptide (TPR) repeat protein
VSQLTPSIVVPPSAAVEQPVPAASCPPRVGRRTLAIAIPLIAAAVLAAHWKALSSPVTTFDDDMYLVDNMLVQHPGWASIRQFFSEVLHPSTVRGYYQPMAMVSLMIDYALGGRVDNLLPFRITSLALHVLNTALAILLVYQLLGRAGPAALTGLLFGVHPMAIESIPWISERKTVLAAFFALLSLIAYVRYTRRPTLAGYALCTALFVLSLLSKPTTTPLPALMLILDAWPLHRLGRRAILEKLPLLVLSVVAAGITYVSQRNTCGVILPTDQSPLHIPYAICHNIVFYLYNIFWPAHLNWHYPFPRPFTWQSDWVRIGVIGTAAWLAVLAVSLRWTKSLAAGWLFFFVAIFPTLGIIGFHPVIAADRHAYLPMIGLMLSLACMMGAIERRLSPARVARLLRPAAVLLVLAAATAEALATRRYLDYWQDNITFREYLLTLDPDNPSIHNGMGMSLARAGRREEALAQFAEAIRCGANDARTWVNWGMVLRQMERIDEAIERYQAALALNPDLPEGRNNLADALIQKGRIDEAITHLQEALRLRPAFAEAHCNLGNAYKALGRHDQAIHAYREGLRWKPYLVTALRNMGKTLLEAGRPEEAEEVLRRAIGMKDDLASAHNDLGLALKAQGLPGEALACVERALALDPTLASAHYNAGNLWIDAGEHDKARQAFARALELEPRFTDARLNLANVLASQGRSVEAMAEYERVLAEMPGSAGAHNNLAALLEEHGRLDEAAGHYEQAVKADPKYADAFYNFAGLRVKQNRLGAALRLLSETLRLAPSHVEASYLRGNILAHQGKSSEAVACYEKVLALDPGHEDARQRLTALMASRPQR